ncbi:VacJ family lipoprotein [Tabrizicola sp. KVB23]|uniref:VacJ family lipoprotein n=2 Tax=Fuscibacter oryzae TaxID=2803939 RepID=A0A8J7MSA3_9RHOB|nr:VacJ family lipoprotein [Fuscibacter oryzae]
MLENVFQCAFRARNFMWLLAVTALTACGPAPVAQGINDPYEQTNRNIHQINLAVDRNVVRPVSRLFGDGDGFVLRRAKNFAGNLSVPGTVVNNLLQLRIADAGQNTLRFAVNSTFGLAGLFDPAGTLGVAPKPTDFGETLHVWGVGEGPYMEVPLVGPSTARDTLGTAVDLVINPTNLLPEPEVYVGVAAKLASRLGDRARYSGTVDSILYDSADSYAQTRLLYLQNRRFELGKGKPADAATGFVDPYEDPYGQ